MSELLSTMAGGFTEEVNRFYVGVAGVCSSGEPFGVEVERGLVAHLVGEMPVYARHVSNPQWEQLMDAAAAGLARKVNAEWWFEFAARYRGLTAVRSTQP